MSQGSSQGYKYPVARPDTKEEWVSSQGPQVKEFEEAWAKYVGTKYAVACSSGTDALKLALAALKIGPGDEVIVPDFTMIATAWAVTYLGATPVFVDCGEDLNIDVDLIEAAITPKTKAIMPVHIYGRPCDMKRIMQIAYEYNLYVVEDAAEAHGATIDGKKVGAWGDIGCFSLYANKIITSGEGGLITTDSERIYKQLQHMKAMAFSDDHSFLHKKLGYNNRMTNLQATVWLEQLGRIDKFLAKREQIRSWYEEKLGAFVLPRPAGSVLWMTDVVVEENKREPMRKYLADAGIETRVFFKPMHEQPMYHGSAYVSNTEESRAKYYSEVGFYLPTHTRLERSDVNFICDKFKEAYERT